MSRGRRSRDRGYISGNRVTSAPTYDEVVVNYLVVAGGGGGGAGFFASGGGAGGLRSTVTATGGGGTLETPLVILTNTNYAVSIGGGGAGSTNQSVHASNGVASRFSTVTTDGGGGGLSRMSSANGSNGGSTGGRASSTNGTIGTPTANQGFSGGLTGDGAGGGGAGAVGGGGGLGMPGGAGVSTTITGTSVTYGGGGGGAGDGSFGAGGSGGGGNGARKDNSQPTVGTTNSGGGGGGGGFQDGNFNGAAGGSGVVILRYSNLYTMTVGAGLAYSTQPVGNDKVTTFTGGSGSISLSPAPVTTGDYESIATVLVGSAGASSITFSNIPQTYKHLQIRFNYSANTTNDNTHIRFNGDTSASYSWHEMYGSSSESPGTVLSSNYGGTLVTTAKFGYVGSTSAGFTGVGTSDILDYTNTNKIKVARHLVGTHTNGSASYVLFRSVAWHNTGAITSITIYSPPGLITQHSHFALYGIRG